MAAKKATQVFEDTVEALQDQAEALVRAMTEGAFGGENTDSLLAEDTSTPEKTAEGFNRDEIGEQYQALDSESKVGEVASLSVQNDIVAGCEKAAVLRFSRRVDLLVEGVQRASGQTSDLGYLKKVLPQLPLANQAGDSS